MSKLRNKKSFLTVVNLNIEELIGFKDEAFVFLLDHRMKNVLGCMHDEHYHKDNNPDRPVFIGFPEFDNTTDFFKPEHYEEVYNLLRLGSVCHGNQVADVYRRHMETFVFNDEKERNEQAS